MTGARAAGGASACTRAPSPISSTRWWRCGFLERDGDGPHARYRNTARDRPVPRSREPAVHGRLPRDGERPPVSLLGRPDRGAAHRQAPERDQAHREPRCSSELYSKPERLEQFMDAMSGHLGRELPGLRREVRLLPLPHALRRRRRHRPALDARRRAAPAPALHLARPAGRHRRSRSGRSPRRASPTASRRARSTSSPSRCRRPT